mmetsp:Transcript_9032/g.16438  ORF Transcript_9032/g.16438 Transcript_9032/m.16438 type:complete len:167 (-) Transcript_9032:177-677(-)|eukprot:CAMPEP_0198289522 /NCGR_PEP_ID=MMETSP1449-20131203/7672_1 /TAXON_ID=420275 /ORGANISM="Attheya septentrionalis, Strain CCMP2084" /LENGTH=166 /DNA_ID=CAMNT_0043987859 /DNA_START=90 /DNA_END=590 /DNA_ORIENTATION=+
MKFTAASHSLLMAALLVANASADVGSKRLNSKRSKSKGPKSKCKRYDPVFIDFEATFSSGGVIVEEKEGNDQLIPGLNQMGVSICTSVSAPNSYLCTGVINFYEPNGYTDLVGQLTTAGIPTTSDSDYCLAITGGTGTFVGATGQICVEFGDVSQWTPPTTFVELC